MDSVSTMDSENMSAWYIQRILQRFLLNTGIQSVTPAPSNCFLHLASIASVEQLNGKNVGILHHIGCKARPSKNAQPQLLASLQHKISRQPEDSTP